jgi:excisionase family DNA binding protein
MEKLWTTAEAARHLGLLEGDVEHLVAQGKLTGYKLGGQFLRFRPDEIKSLKSELTIRPNPKAAKTRRAESWPRQLQDFLYFYDFYIASAGLLTGLIAYLVASG